MHSRGHNKTWKQLVCNRATAQWFLLLYLASMYASSSASRSSSGSFLRWPRPPPRPLDPPRPAEPAPLPPDRFWGLLITLISLSHKIETRLGTTESETKTITALRTFVYFQKFVTLWILCTTETRVKNHDTIAPVDAPHYHLPHVHSERGRPAHAPPLPLIILRVPARCGAEQTLSNIRFGGCLIEWTERVLFAILNMTASRREHITFGK